MAEPVVQRESNGPHVPLTPEFFERITHQEPVPEEDTSEAPWYVRFASAWPSWHRHKD